MDYEKEFMILFSLVAQLRRLQKGEQAETRFTKSQTVLDDLDNYLKEFQLTRKEVQF